MVCGILESYNFMVQIFISFSATHSEYRIKPVIGLGPNSNLVVYTTDHIFYFLRTKNFRIYGTPSYPCDDDWSYDDESCRTSHKTRTSQVKSSSGATRPRGDHPGIRALLHANSSPHPYACYGDLNGVGRRRNLSEAACYRNWPRSR